MNTFRLFSLIFITGSFLINPAISQDSNKEKAQKELNQLFDNWNKFLINGDAEGLKKFISPGQSVYYANDNGISTVSYEEHYKNFISQFKATNYLNMKDLVEPTILLSDDNSMACVLWKDKVEYQNNNSGNNNTITSTGLDVLTKNGDQWQFLASATFNSGSRDSIKIDPNILKDYEGEYKSDQSGNEYTVKASGNNLIFSTEKEELVFIPQSEYSFFMKGFPHSLVFGRDKTGKVTHYTLVSNNHSHVVMKTD